MQEKTASAGFFKKGKKSENKTSDFLGEKARINGGSVSLCISV